MAIDPSRPDQVAPALLAYLSSRLSGPGPRYAEAPEPLGRGWETYTYAFRLDEAGLATDWARPLVLRIYPSVLRGDDALREAAIMRFAAERGYPVPRVFLVESADGELGWPFLVLERAPGVPMLDRMAASPLAARRLIEALADAQVALHRLPVTGCPLPSEGPLVERQIAGFRERIGLLGVRGLEEALAWLEATKGVVLREEASLCHNDFHPNNIVVDDEGGLVVIDWSGAALGDRHHDVAATLVLIRTAPSEPRSLLERAITAAGRTVGVRRYLNRYRKQLPLDAERLRYWEALQAFEWLVRISAMVSLGSAGFGLRADTGARIPPGQLDRVERYFWKRTR